MAGFKCDNGRFLLLIEDNEDILIHSYNISFTFVAEEASEPFHLQLSSHALLGQPSPKSLKFQGCIGGLAVMVLIDIGSSHNILQPRITSHLHLLVHSIHKFSVMVREAKTRDSKISKILCLHLL